MFEDLLLQLRNHLGPTLILALVFIPAFLYFRDHKLKDIFSSVKIQQVMFLTYLSFLLIGTVIGRGHISEPLKSVFEHLWFTSDMAYNKQIMQNIIIFVPYTFLYCFSSNYNNVSLLPLTAILLAFGTSVFFECCQLLFFLGYFQFSDILWNTVGGTIGAGIWIGCKAVRDRVKRL